MIVHVFWTLIAVDYLCHILFLVPFRIKLKSWKNACFKPQRNCNRHCRTVFKCGIKMKPIIPLNIKSKWSCDLHISSVSHEGKVWRAIANWSILDTSPRPYKDEAVYKCHCSELLPYRDSYVFLHWWHVSFLPIFPADIRVSIAFVSLEKPTSLIIFVWLDIHHNCHWNTKTVYMTTFKVDVVCFPISKYIHILSCIWNKKLKHYATKMKNIIFFLPLTLF